MSLDALASVGEFIGGIGVLVTLIFVALQLRQNTRAIQRSNAREAGNDAVFNNAGIGVGRDIRELNLAHFDRSIDVNIGRPI